MVITILNIKRWGRQGLNNLAQCYSYIKWYNQDLNPNRPTPDLQKTKIIRIYYVQGIVLEISFRMPM